MHIPFYSVKIMYSGFSD